MRRWRDLLTVGNRFSPAVVAKLPDLPASVGSTTSTERVTPGRAAKWVVAPGESRYQRNSAGLPSQATARHDAPGLRERDERSLYQRRSAGLPHLRDRSET